MKHKDYATDPCIAEQWRVFKGMLKSAFMITVFGYSGPKTDAEAIDAMKEAWGSVDERSMEQTAFVTRRVSDNLCACDPWRVVVSGS